MPDDRWFDETFLTWQKQKTNKQINEPHGNNNTSWNLNYDLFRLSMQIWPLL